MRQVGAFGDFTIESSTDLDNMIFPVGSTFVDGISLVVLRGVSHEGRLIGSGVRNQEQEGNRDTRVRQVQVVSTT